MKRSSLSLGLMAASLAWLSASPLGASSHREAPLIMEDPLADNTDVYAFVSPADPTKVTLITNFVPLQDPAGGPNFYRFGDDVLYEIHVDNDADAQEDLSFQFRFNTVTRNPNTFLYNTGPIRSLTDPNWNRPQFYSVSLARFEGRRARRPSLFVPPAPQTLGAALLTPPSNIGPKSTPDYPALAAAAVHNLGNGIRVFAGQREEGFYVDLGATFDLLNIRNPGRDGLARHNVQTIAIEVPKTLLSRTGALPTGTSDPAAIIGVWSTASRTRTRVLPGEEQSTLPAPAGDFVQVSRLGNPLVNEVVIPLGQKDRFNASRPRNDAQFLPYVLDPELGRLFRAGALSLNGTSLPIDVPPAPRNDLVQVFLTGVPGLNQVPGGTPAEMMRLNMAIPPTPPASANRLGVLGGDLAGYPNGRRVGDDVVDISVRAVAGVLVPNFNKSPNNILGDFVDTNDAPYLNTFPYLAVPYAGFNVP